MCGWWSVLALLYAGVFLGFLAAALFMSSPREGGE
jgi:hypothetical protein